MTRMLPSFLWEPTQTSRKIGGISQQTPGQFMLDIEQVENNLPFSRMNQVTREDAEKLVKKLNLITYIDCSALTQDNLKEVFDEAIINAVKTKTKKKTVCSLL